MLIFVGITLALAFENWSADRERRQQELRLLSKISGDLEGKQEDVPGDLSQSRLALEVAEKVTRFLNGESGVYRQGEAPLSDFGDMCSATVDLVHNSAAYASIKSIGLDLIRDDLVRAGTTGVYELTLERIAQTEGLIRDLNFSYCFPILFEQFEITGTVRIREVGPDNRRTPYIDNGELAPKDINELQCDDTIRQVVSYMASLRGAHILWYERLVAEIDQDKTLIEAEMAR